MDQEQMNEACAAARKLRTVMEFDRAGSIFAEKFAGFNKPGFAPITTSVAEVAGLIGLTCLKRNGSFDRAKLLEIWDYGQRLFVIAANKETRS